MGEMADMHADIWFDEWYGDEPLDRCGRKRRFDEFRNDEWQMKDGATVLIRNMSDSHLLAAFKMFGDKRLRDELLIRLFEAKTQREKPKSIFGHLL
jgi:hypothetical protein